MKATTFYGIVAQVKNEIKPHLVINNMVSIEDMLMALEKLGLLAEKPLNKGNANVCACKSSDTVNYGKFDQCLDCGLPKR